MQIPGNPPAARIYLPGVENEAGAVTGSALGQGLCELRGPDPCLAEAMVMNVLVAPHMLSISVALAMYPGFP